MICHKKLNDSQLETFITISQWKSITSEPFIIDIVKSGLKLRFTDEPAPITKTGVQIMPDEIRILLQVEVIYPCMRERKVILCHLYFTQEKRLIKIILNLKQIKKHIEHEHFTMESIQIVLNIIRPNCWMTSVDLKDGLYTVLIHPDHHVRKVSQF